MANRYIMFVDEQTDYDFVQRVCQDFSEKCFMTEHVLTLVADTNDSFLLHIFRWGLRTSSEIKIFHFVVPNGEDYDQYLSASTHLLHSENKRMMEAVTKAWNMGLELLAEVDADKWFDDAALGQAEQMQMCALDVAVKEKLLKQYDPDECEFLLWGNLGLGETAICFNMLEDYSITRQKRLVVLTVNHAHAEVMTEARGVEATAVISTLLFDFLIVFGDRYGSFKCPWRGLASRKAVLSIKNQNPLLYDYPHFWRDYWGLGELYEFHKQPVSIPENAKKIGDKAFKSMNLHRGRTVFLATSGNSFPLTEEDIPFWLHLAAMLREHGYDVVANDVVLDIPGVEKLSLTLLPSAYFIGLCGSIITVSTGFSEICCALNTEESIYCCTLWDDPHSQKWNQHIHAWESRLPYIRKFGEKFPEAIAKSFDMMHDKIWDDNIVAENVVMRGRWEREPEIIQDLVRRVEKHQSGR